MAFPSTLRVAMISGLPGELAFDGPKRGGVAVLNTTTPANNRFGHVLTYRDDTIETVQAGGTGVFAGILQHPKGWAIGSDVMPNGSACEFLIEGEIYAPVLETEDVELGAQLYYVTATGQLTVTAADATILPGAYVARHAPSAENPTLIVAYVPGIKAAPPVAPGP